MTTRNQKPQDYDPLVDQLPSRYVVGIDLGTTNSAVMYVDTHQSPWQVQMLGLPQLVGPHQVESRDTLPSFHYQGLPGEVEQGTLRLPWTRGAAPAWTVGFLARDEGAKSPARQIASAKSWLCHSGIDRTAQVLPWHGAADVERLSPVEVTSRFLTHIRQAWDARFDTAPLSEQDVVVTLPASFDEVARELTVEAARQASLPRVVLIEEPQAAFYAWVYKHRDSWQEHVRPGDTILVCDIGGGTTDFTLIRARSAEANADPAASGTTTTTTTTAESAARAAVRGSGTLQFHRVAVGEHLILGGDNLDLALARHVEQQLADQGPLAPQQWDVLVRACRHVKEVLLSDGAAAEQTIHLPGSGSKLLGGGLQTSVTRDEVQHLLADGFLPPVALSEQPSRQTSGFREFGLPYASDPAITRHLAAFLTSHRDVLRDQAFTGTHDPARPDVVLFNGGFFASPVLRARLLEVLASWFDEAAGQPWRPLVLDNDRLDLAVARGAAYYGMVRRGDGVRIAANLARSYYIAVDDEEPVAVCLVPGSAQQGEDIVLTDRSFQLAVAQPVEFPLLVSSTRLTDPPGALVPIDPEQMKALPPIRTVLRTQRKNERGTVPVTLHAHLTEIGTIDLWCHQVDAERRWRLQFDVRAATQTDLAAHQSQAEAEGYLDEAAWERCEQELRAVFDTCADNQAQPEGLVKRLVAALEIDRRDWPTSLLRRIWETLMDCEAGRRRSPAHEARWLNLLGYALRPGYGLAVDDWRVAETWRRVRDKLAHAAASSRTESLILWRRIAGGLSSGQQGALAQPMLAAVRSLHRATGGKRGARSTVGMAPHESAEVWRLLGSLELLSVPDKVQLGDQLADLIGKRKYEKVRGPMVWTLGRLGQREPMYGPLNTVVPCDVAEKWATHICEQPSDQPEAALAVMQMTRRTEDRYRDVQPSCRQMAIAWLAQQADADHLVTLVRDGGQLESSEQDRVFGESLPKGLKLSPPVVPPAG